MFPSYLDHIVCQWWSQSSSVHPVWRKPVNVTVNSKNSLVHHIDKLIVIGLWRNISITLPYTLTIYSVNQSSFFAGGGRGVITHRLAIGTIYFLKLVINKLTARHSSSTKVVINRMYFLFQPCLWIQSNFILCSCLLITLFT